MSGSTWNAEYWFFGGVNDGATTTGALLMGTDAGPVSVTVNWGSTGPNGANPLVETFAPEADGEFYLPSTNSVRLYNDGIYHARVTALFEDGTARAETMSMYIDLNGTAGIRRLGYTTRDDLMAGGSGNDTFEGRGGDDMLLGGLGNDLLRGGDGRDTLDGGGTGGADGRDTMRGVGGDDHLFGRDGADVVHGDDGNDEVWGEEGADSLYGGNGADQLYGGVGNDRLSGNAGADRFEGGAGADTLVSNSDGAADIFVFSSRNGGMDRITGFEEGLDKIALSFISAEKGLAMRLVSSIEEMTDKDSYLIYDAASGSLMFDINGTAANGRNTLALLERGTELSLGDFLFG